MRTSSIAAALFLALAPFLCRAQEQAWEIESLTPGSEFVYDLQTGAATGTNGVMVKYGGAVLTAARVTVNQQTGETLADGNVRIQRDNQVWVGEHMRYNFKTSVMESEQFRTGRAPVFAEGRGLTGNQTNNAYWATNAYTTPDDFSQPAVKIRTSRIKLVPGKYVEARNAVLFLGGVPVFYFPYYHRSLAEHANHFDFTPGYRSSYGPFLLSRYTWYLNDEFDGALHLDYRQKRGVGAGPDVNYHLGRWGEGTVKYYYLHDEDTSQDNDTGGTIPSDRQRVNFSYLAMPYTNFSARSQVRYQSDSQIVRDFFETEYRQNTEPDSYLELNKFWQNFSLDTYVQPRVNDFFQTVERLPDVRLTGYRQQVGNTPVFYQSESSIGYFRQLYAETNGPAPGDYGAWRADSFHQLVLPETFFGWLNVTPRVGGRFTYYSEASGRGATNSANSDEYRAVFNTGAEMSFKVSRVWAGATNAFFQVDGIRHIAEPSVNYSYVPQPNRLPSELPQFDSTLPSLRLLPIDFPEFNSIDSIAGQSVLRYGIRNKLQTKRDGEIVNLLNWDLYTDWWLRQGRQQTNYHDIFSDLVTRPRSWLILNSQTRYDTRSGSFRLALHSLTIEPNNVWNWSLSHFYVRNNDPELGATGENLISSSLLYRLNENWGTRLVHQFDARIGQMTEQDYVIYRDLRSWTAALVFRVREDTGGPQDVTVAFTFSLKARPRYGVGSESAKPYSLLGGG